MKQETERLNQRLAEEVERGVAAEGAKKDEPQEAPQGAPYPHPSLAPASIYADQASFGFPQKRPRAGPRKNAVYCVNSYCENIFG